MICPPCRSRSISLPSHPTDDATWLAITSRACVRRIAGSFRGTTELCMTISGTAAASRCRFGAGRKAAAAGPVLISVNASVPGGTDRSIIRKFRGTVQKRLGPGGAVFAGRAIRQSCREREV